MQSPMAEDDFGLKLAPVESTLEAWTDNRNKHKAELVASPFAVFKMADTLKFMRHAFIQRGRLVDKARCLLFKILNHLIICMICTKSSIQYRTTSP